MNIYEKKMSLGTGKHFAKRNVSIQDRISNFTESAIMTTVKPHAMLIC